MFIAARCLFWEETLSEASLKAPCGSWVFDVLFSIMMVSGRSRHGAVSLDLGGWIVGVLMVVALYLIL